MVAGLSFILYYMSLYIEHFVIINVNPLFTACTPYLSEVYQVVSLEKQPNNLLNNLVVLDVAVLEMDEVVYQD